MSDDQSTPSDRRPIFAAVGKAAWKQLLILIWGLWWGGLCFYAVVVVPIGTEVIGSVEQGFITQQVTKWHNLSLFVFVVILFIEATRRRSRILFIMGIILTVTGIALGAWHIHLSAIMDFHQKSVPTGFYADHAIYLWLTAIEWFTGLAIPVWLFEIKNRSGQTRSESRKSSEP